jgi:Ca2+-binding RTX toxin-like protein
MLVRRYIHPLNGYSPATVAEDGSGNLIYTFSRTGSSSSALTVNYTVAGSASLGIDYSGIAATPASKTLRFAAGAGTAQVIVNPTPDTTSETNETVLLSLAPGSGYTIGTATAVSGTIRNDDIIGTDANNTLIGTEEEDYIFGAAGLDRLRGNGGNDRLAGGAGADTLTGGARDSFHWRPVIQSFPNQP